LLKVLGLQNFDMGFSTVRICFAPALVRLLNSNDGGGTPRLTPHGETGTGDGPILVNPDAINLMRQQRQQFANVF